ncbi:MAG: radical SAM protein [Bryobacteraceae bacterium]|nr:radical SAM protein [Bryobacteraceae bacterium]
MLSSSSPALLREQSGVLHIHLLDRCNLRCDHCYMEAAADREQSLPLDTVRGCLAETEALGIRTVFLSGGEPFLYPQFDSVLEAVTGRSFHAVLCTNGTRIGAPAATAVRLSGASVQVSIDGDEGYHDAFRGMKGAFLRTEQGVHELVRAGVEVSLVTTVCRDNLTMLPWIARWAAGVGIARLSVQPLQALGRGAAIAERRLTEDEVCGLYLSLSDLAVAYRDRGLRFSLAYRPKEYLLEHPCAAYVCNGERCHRGVKKEIKTLIVREDGTVLPEVPTLDPRFALGNVRQGTLVELVQNYFRYRYADFHELCRTAFFETVPAWHSPIVPWDEILSARSWTFELKRRSELCQLASC